MNMFILIIKQVDEFLNQIETQKRNNLKKTANYQEIIRKLGKPINNY